MAKADDARLAVVPPSVFYLEGQSGKDRRSILEVEAAFIKRPLSLGGIVADAHGLSYLQQRADARAYLRLSNT
jgi:hypothetical protein